MWFHLLGVRLKARKSIIRMLKLAWSDSARTANPRSSVSTQPLSSGVFKEWPPEPTDELKEMAREFGRFAVQKPKRDGMVRFNISVESAPPPFRLRRPDGQLS